MPPSREPLHGPISEKDRQFEDLLRRAFNLLNRRQPFPPVMNPRKKRSKVA